MTSDGLSSLYPHIHLRLDSLHVLAQRVRYPMGVPGPPSIHKDMEIFMGHSEYGACVMQVWLTATCPKTRLRPSGMCWSLTMPKAACMWLDSFELGAEPYIQSESCTCMHIPVRCAGVHAQKCESMRYHSRAMIL